MNTIALHKKKKLIELPDDVFRFLSIKAAASGTNLKRYIEMLCAKDVEDANDAAIYQQLLQNRPEGNVMLEANEQADFENWLGIKK